MIRALFVLPLLTIIPLFSFSQNCNFSIDPGQDQVLCEPGDISLSATSSGPPLSVNWSPQNLFSDASSLNTTATISGSTTLELTVEVLSEVNLVVNGDFSQGDTGFSSDYIYGTGGGVGLLSNEGQYAIADNAGDTHNHFDNCNDHTGGGNMMVVNASGLPNNIWCQTIQVDPGTDYDFSTWITSVTDENPAQLQFSINGSLIGEVFNASSNTCNWDQFSAQWNSGLSISAEICIVNSNLTPNGNDFAMDDISFRQICVLTEQLEVTITELDASWINPGLFCENDETVDPNSWLSPTALTGGFWTINEIGAAMFDPGYLGPGLHEVTYTVEAMDCSTSFSWTLGVAPFFEAGVPQELSICEGESVNVPLTDQLSGESPDGSWLELSSNPSTGNAFNPGTGTFNTAGQIPGTYLFEYSHETVDPCPPSSAVVTITINPNPVVNAGEDQTLDCFDPTAIIGNENADMSLSYQWSDINGTIPGATLPSLPVENEGNYTLLVTDPISGCFNTDEVSVISNVSEISMTAVTSPISCNATDDGIISITSISGGIEPYLFSIDGENFTSTTEFTGLSSGNYSLTGVDAFGCETSLQLTLAPSNQLSANLSASVSGSPVIITLGDSLTLNVVTNVSPEKIDTIIWFPESLNCPGCSEITVAPTQSTSYSIFVIDESGCTDSDEIQVIVEKDDNIYIPNAFSPNDDGINDIFYIHSAKGVEKVVELIVVDRWGGLVFQNKDFLPNTSSTGWNGKYRGQLTAAGVYVYMAKIQLKDGSIITKMGEVSVLY
ncbi:MAG: gliding motility-associated C-terminal domain-containing protein [Bacteroidetes bacterium]|nr:MAG: gliding motility-associated C-terminal domain-containing protein [Bacteroidota bacterium]